MHAMMGKDTRDTSIDCASFQMSKGVGWCWEVLCLVTNVDMHHWHPKAAVYRDRCSSLSSHEESR